jgi:hypothetical protein
VDCINISWLDISSPPILYHILYAYVQTLNSSLTNSAQISFICEHEFIETHGALIDLDTDYLRMHRIYSFYQHIIIK